MPLVYISYAIMGYAQKPVWVDPLLARPEMGMLNVYDPTKSLADHLESKNFAAAMAAAPTIDPAAYRLPPHLKSFQEAMPMLEAGDEGEAASPLVWKDLFVLMRSDLIVADITVPSMGGRASELTYAKLWGIPVLCVSHRFVNSPWMVDIADAIVPPKIDNLIGMISHKLSEVELNRRDKEELPPDPPTDSSQR